MSRPCLVALEPQFPDQELDLGHRSEALSPDCWAAGRIPPRPHTSAPSGPLLWPHCACFPRAAGEALLLADQGSALTGGCRPRGLTPVFKAAGPPGCSGWSWSVRGGLRCCAPRCPPFLPPARQVKPCARVCVGPTPSGAQTGQTPHRFRK